MEVIDLPEGTPLPDLNKQLDQKLYFTNMLTSFNLPKILPTNQNALDWLDPLNNTLGDFEINTVNRIAAFMSQCAHESLDFTHLHENLNYRATSLIAVWPSHFNARNADQYAHQPEKIANRAYAGRMGNGDEASGDGWKYRGRGIIQITGKDNYRACSTDLYNDDVLLNSPDLLETNPDVSVKSACWFWSQRDLNSYADAGDIQTITHKINGGYIGLDDRINRFNKAVSVLRT